MNSGYILVLVLVLWSAVACVDRDRNLVVGVGKAAVSAMPIRERDFYSYKEE